jgi:hypothetical protein
MVPNQEGRRERLLPRGFRWVEARADSIMLARIIATLALLSSPQAFAQPNSARALEAPPADRTRFRSFCPDAMAGGFPRVLRYEGL